MISRVTKVTLSDGTRVIISNGYAYWLAYLTLSLNNQILYFTAWDAGIYALPLTSETSSNTLVDVDLDRYIERDRDIDTNIAPLVVKANGSWSLAFSKDQKLLFYTNMTAASINVIPTPATITNTDTETDTNTETTSSRIRTRSRATPIIQQQ